MGTRSPTKDGRARHQNEIQILALLSMIDGDGTTTEGVGPNGCRLGNHDTAEISFEGQLGSKSADQRHGKQEVGLAGQGRYLK